MARSVLTTIRFAPDEARQIKAYVRRNPVFSTISSLGRVATMEFIRTRISLPLSPNVGSAKRPRFLWDYDLTEAQVYELLHHAPFAERKWLVGRLLERLRPPEVFQYLSLEQIRTALPQLRMDPKIQRHWQEAIEVWSRPS